MKTLVTLSVIGILNLVNGCATNLQTFDAEGNKVPGIPVGAPALVRITSTTNYIKVDPNLPDDFCKPETNVDMTFLPIGRITFLKFDPAAFAKGDFKLDFNDQGLLKSVMVNSEANSGLDSVNSLAATLIPFVAAPKTAPNTSTESTDNTESSDAVESADAADRKKKGCLIHGKTVEKIEPLIIGKTQ